MGWYLARRLAAALVTVWIVATAGFLLVEIIPGDPARQLAGPGASAESLAAIREAYGFDDPLPLRYLDSMARMAQGDLGYSFAKAEPVTDVLLRSLPPTLLLTAMAFTVEVLIAVPLALWVVRRGGFMDRLLVILAGATAAIPAFLVGLLLIYVFAFRLRIFPLGGAGSPAAYVLPVLTLGVPFGLVLARLLRTATSRTSPSARLSARRAVRCSGATCCPTRCCRCSRSWRSTSRVSSPASPWSKWSSPCPAWGPTCCWGSSGWTPRSSSASASSLACSWRS